MNTTSRPDSLEKQISTFLNPKGMAAITIMALCNRADNERKDVAISVTSVEAKRILPTLKEHTFIEVGKILNRTIGIKDGELTFSPSTVSQVPQAA